MAESYCCVCDKPAGECAHGGPRYLDAIVYEKTDAGWRVPDDERDRWENPVRATRPAKTRQPIPPPVQRLIVELEGWILLEDSLEGLVRAEYEHDPVVTARLVAATLDGAKAGRLKNPGGYLYKQLKARAKKPAPD